MEKINQAYDLLLTGGAIFLAITMTFCLLRAILGPRLTDRIVAVNVISCKVIVLFAVLAVLRGEFYLLDVAIVYALISFLAVVVLSKVYLSTYSKKQVDNRLKRGGKAED